MEREERSRQDRQKKFRRDPLLSFHGGGAPLLQEQSSFHGEGGAYDSSQHNVMTITITDEEFAAGMVVGGTPDDFGRRGVVSRG